MINALNEQVKHKNQKAVSEITEDRYYGMKVVKSSRQEAERDEAIARRKKEQMMSYNGDLVN
jgi:hypothetical protein